MSEKKKDIERRLTLVERLTDTLIRQNMQLRNHLQIDAGDALFEGDLWLGARLSDWLALFRLLEYIDGNSCRIFAEYPFAARHYFQKLEASLYEDSGGKFGRERG